MKFSIQQPDGWGSLKKPSLGYLVCLEKMEEMITFGINE
jgi:hypothetical protein